MKTTLKNNINDIIAVPISLKCSGQVTLPGLPSLHRSFHNGTTSRTIVWEYELLPTGNPWKPWASPEMTNHLEKNQESSPYYRGW